VRWKECVWMSKYGPSALFCSVLTVGTALLWLCAVVVIECRYCRPGCERESAPRCVARRVADVAIHLRAGFDRQERECVCPCVRVSGGAKQDAGGLGGFSGRAVRRAA